MATLPKSTSRADYPWFDPDAINADFVEPITTTHAVIHVSTKVPPPGVESNLRTETVRSAEESQFLDWLYGLRHGEKGVHEGISYVRVPGGWLINDVFVPFQERMQP